MTAASFAADPVMQRLAAAQQQALDGDRDGARAAFAALWAEVGEDGDPLHVVSIAHHAADVEDDPRSELAWDEAALRAARRLTDERAQLLHPSLTARGFFPSLHLNLADDHVRLGDIAAAREHLAAAEAVAPVLADDDYGRGVRRGIERLRAQLGPG